MPAGDKGAGTWGLCTSQREGCGSKRHYRTCQPNCSRYPGGGPRGFYLVRPAIRERDGRNHPRTWARPRPHGSADVWVLSNPEAAGPRPAPPLTRAVCKHPLGSRVPSVGTPLAQARPKCASHELPAAGTSLGTYGAAGAALNWSQGMFTLFLNQLFIEAKTTQNGPFPSVRGT